ncbi:S-layer homology domain-containing protein [Sporomusa termitida]|uniref:SLH domain-containing protein n=1 Tax=Sporomusa termitida TaxID=2377 RepID=A0A517DSH0_9FIRM|nr:S-layer homology domain-containing protein [Sporomusa termitida]QDR80277.1 hypothetical protein SPTER_15970 [Sporomusa termitida]
MKKTLVTLLALVFVLSIASSVFAAPNNSFVDLPAKHWAYVAVQELARVGIIDGYGDGEFRGEKSMTRYEMAQIVYQAMQNSSKADAVQKALIDKLAAEFALELNNLDKRVAKLETKNNVGLTYESRIRYMGNEASTVKGTSQFDYRQRIHLNGAVNDKVAYTARLEAGGYFGNGSTGTIGFNRAFFNIKDFAGIDMITIGRFGTHGITNGLLNAKSMNNDGVIFTQKLSDVTTAQFMVADVATNSEFGLLNLNFKASKDLKLNIAYTDYGFGNVAASPLFVPTAWNNMGGNQIDVGLNYKHGGLYLMSEYVANKISEGAYSGTNPKAWMVQLATNPSTVIYPFAGIVNPAKAHDQGFLINYRNIDANAVPVMSAYAGASSYNGNAMAQALVNGMYTDDNVKALTVAYQNVFSKGVVFTAAYSDLKQKVGTLKDKEWDLSFQFFF